MSAIPTWLAATAGQPGNAGAVNQLLGSHSATILYGGGTLQSSQTTGAAVYQSTSGQWLAQQITTGPTQTTIGQVLLQLSAVGGSPTLPLIPALTVSLYADAGGLPSGAAIASATAGEATIYGATYWVTVPLVAPGLAASTAYHLVTGPAGGAEHYYTWQQSTLAGGAATSPDGVSWTSQGFGLTYQVYDAAGSGSMPTLIYEDGGARSTEIAYNTNGQPVTITETTAGQAGGSLQTTRTIAYSGALPIGVS